MPRQYVFDAYTLDVDRARLLRRGEVVSLRPKAFDALRYLVENSGRIASKDELLQALWPNTVVTEDSLTKCIQEIRAALEDEVHRYVKTVPRRGYLFDAEVETLAGAESGQPAKSPRWRAFVLVAIFTVIAIGFMVYRIETGRPAPTDKSVAVLPFANLSSDSDNDYFAAGVHESILNQLVRVGDLNTIARTTMLRYADTDLSVAEIAAELNVATIMEGSVRYANDRVLVTAQLIDPETGLHLWSQEYDRPLDNIFAIQSDIARRIALELEAELSAEEQQHLATPASMSLEAYDLYLRGRYHWDKTTVRDTQQSITYYEQAIDIDPQFAAAYAGLADAYTFLHALGTELPHDVLAKAKAAANRALQIDPDLAEGYVSRGLIRFFTDYDYEGGSKDFEMALSLSPNLAIAHQLYGKNLPSIRRFESAERHHRRALALDPFSVSINKDYGETLLYWRRYDDAVMTLTKTLELEPGHAPALFFLSRTYEAMGKQDLAVRAYLGMIDGQMPTDLTTPLQSANAESLRQAYLQNGWRGFWRRDMELTLADASQGVMEPYRFVERYVRLGDYDSAFEWIERCFDYRSAWIPLLLVDPLLDPLRDDPRFAPLIERANLQAYAGAGT